MKVFLGGTCNDSTWRNELIPLLEANGIDYFNPLVDDWTPECKDNEDFEKYVNCNTHLYVITPKQIGFYSFAEIIDSAALGYNVIFAYLIHDGYHFIFNESQIKSLEAIGGLLMNHETEEAYIDYDHFADINVALDDLLDILLHIKHNDNN